jgi:hypothetical protein
MVSLEFNGPGADSASNINEYQQYFLGRGGKGGRCVGLITLSPSCTDCLEIWEPQPCVTLRACPGLYRDGFTFQKPSAQARYKPNTLGLCVSHRIPSVSEVLVPYKRCKTGIIIIIIIIIMEWNGHRLIIIIIIIIIIMEWTQINSNNNNNNNGHRLIIIIIIIIMEWTQVNNNNNNNGMDTG